MELSKVEKTTIKSKSKYAKFRVSEEELAKLISDAAQSGLPSLSEYLRTKIDLPSKRDYRLLLFHISRIGNNINQLARTMNILHKKGKLDNSQLSTAFTRLLCIQSELENIRIDFKNNELEINKQMYS